MSEWWQVVEPDILRIIIRAFVGMVISFVLLMLNVAFSNQI